MGCICHAASAVVVVPRAKHALFSSTSCRNFVLSSALGPQHRFCSNCNSWGISWRSGTTAVTAKADEKQLFKSPNLVALEYADLNIKYNGSEVIMDVFRCWF